MADKRKGDRRPVVAQIDSADFLLNFQEALKDNDVCKSLNNALDFSKISKEIALEVGKQIKVLKEELNKKDVEIGNLTQRCNDLEKRNDDLEQYTRKNSLRFAGLEQPENENPTDTVMQVCNSLLKVQPPIEPSDIDNAHRLGEGTPRALIVKFTNFRARRRVFEAKRRLKDINKLRKSGKGGTLYPKFPDQPSESQAPAVFQDAEESQDDDTPAKTPSDDAPTDDDPPDDPQSPKAPPASLPPIFVNEDLTRARNHLLYQARLLKKEMKISDAWSFEGRIRIKDMRNVVHRIDSVSALDIFR